MTDEAQKPAAKKTKEPAGYVIAAGRSVTTRRGVKSEGDAVTPDDFEAPEAFPTLCDGGYIVPEA